MGPRLTWKHHVENTKRKVRPRINLLKTMTGLSWGADPRNMLNVYKGYIRPILDWDCQVITLDTNKELTLDRLQYASLRAVLSLMITTPTNVLLDLNGETTLTQRRKMLTKKFLIKAGSRPKHIINKIFNKFDDTDSQHGNVKCNLMRSYAEIRNVLCDIKKFNLPDLLQVSFDTNIFIPTTNTDIGKRVEGSKNPNQSFIN